jgi:trigger factor
MQRSTSTRRDPAQAAPQLRPTCAAADEVATEDDRVTIDFEGKIDGEPFAGGKAEAFQFIVGEGQHACPSSTKAVRGMKAGESKTFPV